MSNKHTDTFNLKIKEARLLLRLSPYRNMSSPKEKAFSLVKRTEFSNRVVSKATGIPASTISSLRKYERFEEVPIKGGRPKSLTFEEEQKVLEIVEKRCELNNCVRKKELKSIVCNLMIAYRFFINNYLGYYHIEY